MTPRREFTKNICAQAFQRANGHCEKCTAKLYVGKYAYDHIIADALGGEPTLENCQVLCSACHMTKTAKFDTPAAAKVKRITAKHIGAKRKGFWGCGRNTKWRRKMNGTTELR